MSRDDDDLTALASDQVTELFGWPVKLLDELGELRALARRGEIDIEEWRRRDRELRNAGPGQYPRDQIMTAFDAACDRSLAARRERAGDHDQIDRLVTRLKAALDGAPDDDQLCRELEQLDVMLDQRLGHEVRAVLEKDRELVVWWLTSGTAFDRVTGLPWDYLGRYRWLTDAVLGLVPAPVDVARGKALAEAPEEISQLARRLCPDARPDPLAMGALEQHALTWFPHCVVEAAGRGDQDADAVADQVLQLWQAPETQRFLLRQTARGWPENLHVPDVGRQPVQS